VAAAAAAAASLPASAAVTPTTTTPIAATPTAATPTGLNNNEDEDGIVGATSPPLSTASAFGVGAAAHAHAGAAEALVNNNGGGVEDVSAVPADVPNNCDDGGGGSGGGGRRSNTSEMESDECNPTQHEASGHSSPVEAHSTGASHVRHASAFSTGVPGLAAVAPPAVTSAASPVPMGGATNNTPGVDLPMVVGVARERRVSLQGAGHAVIAARRMSGGAGMGKPVVMPPGISAHDAGGGGGPMVSPTSGVAMVSPTGRPPTVRRVSGPDAAAVAAAVAAGSGPDALAARRGSTLDAAAYRFDFESPRTGSPATAYVPSTALRDRITAYLFRVDPRAVGMVPALLTSCRDGADAEETAVLLAGLEAKYDAPVPSVVHVARRGEVRHSAAADALALLGGGGANNAGSPLRTATAARRRSPVGGELPAGVLPPSPTSLAGGIAMGGGHRPSLHGVSPPVVVDATTTASGSAGAAAAADVSAGGSGSGSGGDDGIVAPTALRRTALGSAMAAGLGLAVVAALPTGEPTAPTAATDTAPAASEPLPSADAVTDMFAPGGGSGSGAAEEVGVVTPVNVAAEPTTTAAAAAAVVHEPEAAVGGSSPLRARHAVSDEALEDAEIQPVAHIALPSSSGSPSPRELGETPAAAGGSGGDAGGTAPVSGVSAGSEGGGGGSRVPLSGTDSYPRLPGLLSSPAVGAPEGAFGSTPPVVTALPLGRVRHAPAPSSTLYLSDSESERLPTGRVAGSDEEVVAVQDVTMASVDATGTGVAAAIAAATASPPSHSAEPEDVAVPAPALAPVVLAPAPDADATEPSAPAPSATADEPIAFAVIPAGDDGAPPPPPAGIPVFVMASSDGALTSVGAPLVATDAGVVAAAPPAPEDGAPAAVVWAGAGSAGGAVHVAGTEVPIDEVPAVYVGDDPVPVVVAATGIAEGAPPHLDGLDLPPLPASATPSAPCTPAAPARTRGGDEREHEHEHKAGEHEHEAGEHEHEADGEGDGEGEGDDAGGEGGGGGGGGGGAAAHSAKKHGGGKGKKRKGKKR